MSDIHFKENIVKRNKIPVLIYHPVWIQLFNNYKSEEMEVEIAKLEAHIKREKECEKEIRDGEQRKKTLMKKVLYISNEINENDNKEALIQMDEAQKELMELNEKLPLLMEELEMIPSLINEQNTEVLKTTIKRGYELIKESKEEASRCQEEVNELRKALAELIKNKVDLEVRANHLYTFVHGLLGAVEMDKMDKNFLKEWESLKK